MRKGVRQRDLVAAYRNHYTTGARDNLVNMYLLTLNI
jgi:hypothetical protein